MTAELYAHLELEPGADKDAVRAAYFRLAKTLHPDRQAGDDPEATERFLQIQRAYEILTNPAQLLEYERTHGEGKVHGSAFTAVSRPVQTVVAGKAASGPSDQELADAERAFQRAEDLLQAGRSEPALRAMQAVVRVVPRSARYRSLLGYCLALEGKNLHAARDHCRYAVESEPFEADHQARLGFVYQQAGLQRTADKCFRDALRIEPKNAIARAHFEPDNASSGVLGSLKRIFSGS